MYKRQIRDDEHDLPTEPRTFLCTYTAAVLTAVLFQVQYIYTRCMYVQYLVVMFILIVLHTKVLAKKSLEDS